MKFLVLLKFKAGGPPPDPKMIIGLNEAVKGWIKGNLSAGKLDCAFNLMPNGEGYYGMGISNADSLEAAFHDLTTYPAFLASDIVVYPLTEVISAIDDTSGALRMMMGGS